MVSPLFVRAGPGYPLDLLHPNAANVPNIGQHRSSSAPLIVLKVRAPLQSEVPPPPLTFSEEASARNFSSQICRNFPVPRSVCRVCEHSPNYGSRTAAGAD